MSSSRSDLICSQAANLHRIVLKSRSLAFWPYKVPQPIQETLAMRRAVMLLHLTKPVLW
jgi:hypothetical protein